MSELRRSSVGRRKRSGCRWWMFVRVKASSNRQGRTKQERAAGERQQQQQQQQEQQQLWAERGMVVKRDCRLGDAASAGGSRWRRPFRPPRCWKDVAFALRYGVVRSSGLVCGGLGGKASRRSERQVWSPGGLCARCLATAAKVDGEATEAIPGGGQSSTELLSRI